MNRTLSTGVSYLSSMLSYHFGTRPHPFSAAFNITDHCNLDCHYCNFGSFSGEAELKLAQIETLLQRIYKLGVRRLGIVGGEPLMRRDLRSVLEKAHQIGFFLSLSSNLTLYQSREKVFDYVDLVFTSLDGDASQHQTNRGQGSFAGVLDAIQDLRRKEKKVVGICVIRDGNLDRVHDLLAQARRLGISMHFQPQCVAAPITRGNLPETTTHEELRNLWRELLRLKRAGEPVASSTSYLQTQMAWRDYQISASFDPSTHCAAGLGFIFISPQGRASPCTFTRGRSPEVNLLTDDWPTAWNRRTECTRCNVGPMLEFNLLYRKPVRSLLNIITSYS